MKLKSLQALRGLAALGVTLHHCTTLVERFVGSTGALGRHASVGLLGVDLFFVLSGFIILNSHFADERGGWGAGGRYTGKRLLRIFIPYLPITLLYVAALSALPSLSDS